MYWRLGFPGWRIAATLGLPIWIKIEIFKDDEASVYCATNDNLGLAVESSSLDGLMLEIDAALPVLLKLAHTLITKPVRDMRISEHHAMA